MDISKVKYIKVLEVLLDEHLNGKYHIAELSNQEPSTKNLTKKLARTCVILLRVRDLL